TGAKVVLATTGYSFEQYERIKYSSKNVAIFHSSNMSLGVNLLGKLAKDATRFLKGDYDIEIIEAHHNKKADAPSGTALTLAKEINKAQDNSLDLLFGRGNGKRSKNEIGIHSIRGGTTPGKHSVAFFGNGENITLSHEAESKDVFVSGALRAVKFIVTKESGLYDMSHLLLDSKPALSISTECGLNILSIMSMSPTDWAFLFKGIHDNNIAIDEVSTALNDDGSMPVQLSFKDSAEKISQNLKDIQHTTTLDVGKIVISGVENGGLTFEVLSLLKSVGAKVQMIVSSNKNMSIFVDETSLIKSKYAIKSFLKI
ncbi:MAG: 4-hydroxy-tetrahydrodipicolinate reductase, partial [Clostridia bacterium]|nr:4-hydroxy-tetrahydrodipicolinate reductase [Clostridia bacterium]